MRTPIPKMARPFSVVVTDPVDLDLSVFSLWLQDYNVTDATRERTKNESKVTSLFHDYSSLLHSETEEMYRLFNSIEPYLQSPTTFLNQSVFQVQRAWLLEGGAGYLDGVF